MSTPKWAGLFVLFVLVIAPLFLSMAIIILSKFEKEREENDF